MGRFGNRLNTVLNIIFIVMTALLAVLGILSLVTGPTLRFAPYMTAVCGIYYLCTAVAVFVRGSRKSVLKGVLLLCLALFCGVMSFVIHRSFV